MYEADDAEYPLPQKFIDRPETMTLDRHNGFLKEPVEGVYYIDQLHKVGVIRRSWGDYGCQRHSHG